MSVEVTRMALKRHELLEELQAVIARQLEDMGTAPDAASVIGSSAVDYLSTYWAGQVVTFPKDAQYKLTLKELEIYDQFDGRNKDDLARRYGMTPRGMGKLLKRIRDKIKNQNAAAAAAGQLDLIDSQL
ncbi:Mor family transcriptional regulator [Acidovorax delafieldii]|uniref:Mor family transcriptional regulator n=1 Tax=Acidovorax delafieldii TaxID=47920 RepID=A0AAJ2BU59_ACIDE|nr:Mor transcription activator family protein [Acidovorax delafieldii]MDR6767513.1 Mor family transcriptional regulator [Acidovorax delafieldii]MDR6838735.1 Mor family transcriptional regulator [Acidovorax delafieldii]MDR7368604.1 Mor family transcriptional regulator [Acidovorax delafieldii]